MNRHRVLTPLVNALLWPLTWLSAPVWAVCELLTWQALRSGYEPERVIAAIVPLVELASALDRPWQRLWWGYLDRFEDAPAPRPTPSS